MILFWIFYGLPTILLNVPTIQKQVTQKAVNELSGRLGVPVRIEKVYINWLNRLVLDGVYLEDQHGEILFEANHVAAGFKLLPLLQGKFVFTTARIFGFNLNLTKETPQSELNLQFVIDAFASQDTIPKDKDIDLRFNSILIRRGAFSYHVLSEPEAAGKFNPAHVNIQNLSANISLKAFNKDSLNANIKRISLDEASGFHLNKLSLNIVGNRDSAYIQNFEVKLPQTNLQIGRAQIDFTSLDSLSNLVDHAPVMLDIAPSQICLKDLAAFVPAFINFTDTIDMMAEASGFINDIDLNKLTLSYSDKMLFNGRMSLRGITHPEETYVFGEVSQMYITNDGIEGLVNNFSDKPVILPDPVKKLGAISFKGEISGFFDNLVAYGKLTSPIGEIQTDVLIGSNKEKGIATIIKGEISSSDLALDELFPPDNPFGSGRFRVRMDAQRPVNGYISGNITADIPTFDYRDYRYENIRLSGRFAHNSFDGSIDIDDPNGQLSAVGMFRNQGRNSLFNFQASLNNFHPDRLNLLDKFESPDISFFLNADFTGNSIDNMEGVLRVDTLSFRTAADDFYLDQLEIRASGHTEDRRLSIVSDVINGEVNGAYSFTTLIPSVLNTFREYIPALINTKAPAQKTYENNFTLRLDIENTEKLSNTFQLPVAILAPTHITGEYSNTEDNFRLEAYLPAFRIQQNYFENGFVSCDNPAGLANLIVQATQFNQKGLRNYIDLKATAHNNELNTHIIWANNKERLFKADLFVNTLFREEIDERKKKNLITDISIGQSPFVVNDTTWYIQQAEIQIKNKDIAISDFRISRENQYILIDGKISEDPADSLTVDLNDIELSYIFEILNNPVLQFAGKATGTFHLNDLYGSRILSTDDLEVRNFSFNQVDFGRLNLFSKWDDEQQGIFLSGNIYKTDSIFTAVNGYIYPVGEKAGLSLHFNANDIDIAFLQPFMDNVAKGVRGHGFGQVHLFGPFSGLSIEGEAYVADGGLGIEFLNTYYTFSDSVLLTPGSIVANNIRIYDTQQNEGIANLRVNHTHFKDIDYDVHVQASKLHLYNVTEKQNPEIYGTVYGSGSARISGNEKLVNIDVNMRTEPQTAVVFNFMRPSTAEEYNFITFVDKTKIHPVEKETELLPVDSVYSIRSWENESAEIRMNFLVDVTPEANFTMIMDPVAGDKIEGYGTGRLEVEWGNRKDLRMNGGVTILSGKYNYSLQQLLHWDFMIKEGSNITFLGNPLNPYLNIEAIYSLYANISDLHSSFAQETARTSIPVNCIIHLEGTLQNLATSFDIDFPGSSEDLLQKAKSYINTEDMMNRQILFLLAINKFYTMDEDYRTNEFSAVASSALSYQLSSILNSITDKVQIGTNIRTGGQEKGVNDTEVEMLLSSRLLNNRLIFNGNFGYKNNLDQGNIFVGEFDIEYMLTRSGEIRVKFYNHANDMYRYLKQSLTTQGLGLMYRKDFTHISEIFRRRRRYLLPAGTTPVLPERVSEEEPTLPAGENE